MRRRSSVMARATAQRALRIACLVALVLVGVRPAFAAESIPLASLDLSHVEQGWGKPQVDRSVDGHPITLGGCKFEHGLGTHSPGDFLIDLDGGVTHFTAWVGIDDETANRGSVEFQVVGDGKLLWNSGILRGGQPPKQVDIALTGVRHLALLVSDAGDGFEYDHADWADAVFTVTGAAPRSVKMAPSHPTIAMPETPDRPHITSPARFGALRGTPVLYTIDAVGKPPLTFAVRNLPPGLKLDAATGQITGTPVKGGEYAITMIAKNAAGTDTRPLRLIVGDSLP